MSSLVDTDTARQLSAKFHAVSATLAKACEHLGSAIRGSHLKLFEAVNAGDSAQVTEIIEKIRNSELLVGTSAKFQDISEQARKLWDQLAPTAHTVLGLTLLIAGALLLGKAGILTVLLMFGGFLVVISGLLRFNTTIPESGTRFVILAFLFASLQLQPNVARGADSTPIEGKTWQLNDLTGFPGFDAELRRAPHRRAPHFRLGPGSKFLIYDGCNDFRGDYVSTSDSITVRTWVGTQVACTGRQFRTDSDKFMALFEGTVTWRIVGGELQLLNKVGQVEAVFIAK